MNSKTKATIYVFFKPFVEGLAIFFGILALLAGAIILAVLGAFIFRLPFIAAIYLAPSLANYSFMVWAEITSALVGFFLLPCLAIRAASFYGDVDERMEVERKAAEFAKSEPAPNGPKKGGISLYSGGHITEVK